MSEDEQVEPRGKGARDEDGAPGGAEDELAEGGGEHARDDGVIVEVYAEVEVCEVEGERAGL